MRESNSHQRFWRPLSYHLTNPLYGHCSLQVTCIVYFAVRNLSTTFERNLNLWVEKTSAGESGYGAGEHAFARIAAQRYIRAQRTRSKCRRRFTALHHHTRTPRLRFLRSQFQIQTEEKKTELYRLIRKLCSVLMFENGCISCLKSGNRINIQPQPKKFCLRFSGCS